jgi:hypothetical protein
MRAYLGVDWSAKEVVCAVAIGAGPVRRLKAVRRTFADVQALVEQVRLSDPSIEEVHVIIEAGSPGWAELFHHAGAVVHVADPKQAKKFAESLCSSGAKDDGRDAEYLVDMGRSPPHLPEVWLPEDEVRAQLVELGGMHEALTRDCTAAEQRLRCLLRERAPAFEAALDDLSRGWVIRLLREVPTPWHAASLTEADFRRILDRSGARETTKVKVIKALAETRVPWLTARLARVHALHVRQLVDQIESLTNQLATVEKELDELTRGMELRKQMESVGGIATKMASRLLEFAFSSVPEHRDQAGVQLGASPVFQGSGRTSRGKAKGKAVMRRAAPPRARATSYLLGRLASQQLGWAGRMYGDGRQRGQDAATVYRRIARCLLRILTAMARTGELYNDERYEQKLREKGVRWAISSESSAA